MTFIAILGSKTVLSCENYDGDFLVNNYGVIAYRDCKWVGYYPNYRCVLGGVAEKCPITCNKCPHITSVPSVSPTKLPTALPTTIPSKEPSASPSAIPSKTPSSSPSTIPSQHPSTLPSVKPSLRPTAAPSRVPSNIPSFTPSQAPTSECSELLMGKTIFSEINAMGQKMCIKMELFLGGMLAIDESNSDCTATNESTSLKILSSFQSITDEISFDQGNLGSEAFVGQFEIVEDPVVSKIETNLFGLFMFNQTFQAELKIPSCIAPSSAPSTIHSPDPSYAPSTECSQLPGSTIFSKIAPSAFNPNDKVCMRIELFPGGKLSIDNMNPDCTAENASSSLNTVTSFESITDDKILFVGQVWSGQFIILEDPTITEIETELLTLAVINNIRTFDVELRIPTCIASSSSIST